MDLKKNSIKIPKLSGIRLKRNSKDAVQGASDNSTGGKLLGALCYLGILILIPVFWSNKSPQLQSHLSSGIVILALWVVLPFVFQIPLFGVVLGLLLLIGVIIFSIWGIYDALGNRQARIPGVENIAMLLQN